jgi:nicotinate-nucleotide adenylyltransferase
MRIGLFGGSFDPVHTGHVYLVHALKAKYQLDKVIIFPAWVSPFKLNSPPKASGEDRMAMLRLAFSGEKGIEFSSCELDRKGASYTIDTVRELKKNYLDDELYLLLAQETLESFPKWKEKEGIEKLCNVVFGDKKENISSTLVREALKRGEECKEFLSPEILDYIRKKGLYS